MSLLKNYNKHIEIFYNYDLYQKEIFPILETIKKYKSIGICINRTNLIDSYKKIYEFKNENVPIQIFTGSPKSYKRKSIDKKELSQILSLQNDKYYLTIFIHSIYIINLSRDIHINKNVFEYLKKEFEISHIIKSKGVVFHVGKEVKMGKELAIQNMKQNILEILNLASNSSPFILETPAGQDIIINYLSRIF